MMNKRKNGKISLSAIYEDNFSYKLDPFNQRPDALCED